MSRNSFKNKFIKIPGILAVALMLFFGTLCFGQEQAYAASGTVYTCTINRCYRHPVNGKIEDAGGESSYATGQGMVEGCVYGTGILEVTDSGKYYLTIRMSLFDYTSKHSFKVQKWGASKYSNPAVGITGSGKDSNGTTKDICIQIPSEKSVVRFTMYVEPMGRSVVAYFYPSNFKKGNSTNMKATIVTAASGSGSTTGNSTSKSSGSASSGSTSGSSTSGTATGSSGKKSSGSSSASTGSSSKTSESSNDSSSDNSSDSTSSDDGDASSTMEEPTASSLQSGATGSSESDSSGGESSDTGSSGSGSSSKAQGLSLSTEKDAGGDDTQTSSTGNYGIGKRILVNVVSGIIISAAAIAMAAGVFYLFRKNYSKWFKTAKDDPFWTEEEESGEQDEKK